MIHGYIPDQFKDTFMGFPRKLPIDKIEAAKKKERKAQLARWKKAFQHKSHGWLSLRREIKNELNKSYRWEDDFHEFNPEIGTRKIFELIRKKGLLKYLK